MRMEFWIPGEPKGKGRPKFVRAGQHVRAITPDTTVIYENLVKTSFLNQTGGTEPPEEYPFEGPVEAEIEAVFPVPKSVSKKKRAEMLAGAIPHTKKPDLDNLAKGILDALNGVAYADDRQIWKLTVYRRYGEVPGARVILKQTEGENGEDQN